jgi:hypothetical protein
VDLSGLLVPEGATARASGRVLVSNAETWFERPGPTHLMLVHPRPTPAPSRNAIRAHGVDLAALDHRDEYNGVLTGWATLTGTWSGHELHVLHQGPRVERSNPRDRWRTPPCAPPPQGWPEVDGIGNLTEHPPPHDRWPALTITTATLFRVDAEHGVYVVAAEDPDRAARAVGDRMCVVPSRYTRHQLDQARSRLHEEMEPGGWPLTSHGETSAADGQPQLTVGLLWVVPDMVEWAATLPDGMLDLDVWLRPAV